MFSRFQYFQMAFVLSKLLGWSVRLEIHKWINEWVVGKSLKCFSAPATTYLRRQRSDNDGRDQPEVRRPRQRRKVDQHKHDPQTGKQTTHTHTETHWHTVKETHTADKHTHKQTQTHHLNHKHLKNYTDQNHHQHQNTRNTTYTQQTPEIPHTTNTTKYHTHKHTHTQETPYIPPTETQFKRWLAVTNLQQQHGFP